MPSLHAKLQPSAAKRWLNCPGSVALCENAVDTGGQYADEGTACHEICEQVLNGKPWPKPGAKASNGVVITEEMITLCRPCVAFVQEYQDATGATIHTEMRVEIGKSFGLPEGMCFGTSDIVARSERELGIFDFKFGYNEVQIEEDGKPNAQLALYARGAGAHPALALGGTERVRLAILQPKCGEPKEKGYSIPEMLGFFEEIHPKVVTASKGGPLVPGPWCGETYCKAQATCPALRSEMIALAQREFAENVMEYTPADLGDLLLKLELLEPAAAAIRNHALTLMELGTEIPGWKRVAGRTLDAWTTDEEGVVPVLKKAGVEPYVKSLITPAAAREAVAEILYDAAKKAKQKLTRKDATAAARSVLAKVMEKPAGKPTLAKASDPRPALGPAFTAEDVAAAEGVTEID